MNVPSLGESAEIPVPTQVETRRDRLIRLAIALQRLGVSSQQVGQLLSTHDLDMVEQQLLWFPARKARKKASLIVAAIRDNYEKPANFEK